MIKLPNETREHFLRKDSTPENYQTSHRFGDNTIWYSNHEANVHLNNHAEKLLDARFWLAEIALLEYHDTCR